MKNTNKKRLRR